MKPAPPDALLLVGTHCPFCPTVLAALGELVKAGRIGRLEVINVEQRPDAAHALGIRTVPWLRLGPFELDGLRSQAELEQWAARAGTEDGVAAYVSELLVTGALRKLVELVQRDPVWLDALPRLAADPETNLQVRVGIAALLEELGGEPVLARLVDPLGALTRHPQARLRSDACHYLGLIRDRRALAYVEPLLADADNDVREVAAESALALGRPVG